MLSYRHPLNLSRLTRLQFGLVLACALFLITIVMLMAADLHSVRTTEEMTRSGYHFTDLATIQRTVQRLHVATVHELREPPYNLDALEIQWAMLSHQLRMAAEDADDGTERAQLLSRLRNDLAEFTFELMDAQIAPEAIIPGLTLTRMDEILSRMSNEASRLYDQEETAFFLSLDENMAGQRAIRHLLAVLSLALLTFGGMLVVSLRHSVMNEFDRTYAMLESLFHADESMHRRLTPPEVEETIVSIVADIFGADKVVLMHWDAEASALYLAFARGISQRTERLLQDGLHEGISHQVAMRGEHAVVNDTYQDRHVEQRIIDAEGIRSMMAVPISLRDEIHAVLSVCSVRPHAFDSDTQRLLAALGRRAASAIENALAYERAELAATLEERQRLARELHDAVTQTLFSASLIAEVLPRIWERDADMGRQRLDELRELTRGALAEMRALLVELLPGRLIETDMDELLSQLAEAVTGRARIPVDVQISDQLALPPQAKVVIYRVAQEALNNVTKHSGADQVQVSLLSQNGTWKLEIHDNGRGFDLSAIKATSLGLGIMQERAQTIGAQMEIESEIGKGTCVRLNYCQNSQGSEE